MRLSLSDRIRLTQTRIDDLTRAIEFNRARPSYLRCYDYPRYVRRLADNRRRLKRLMMED